MANISINEISQNYQYNIGNSSYATVALPITACWGPGYDEAKLNKLDPEEKLESIVWSEFPATQTGLESFISTYRGSISNYRLINDYSYQMAMTLLTSGYNVLTCRVANGSQASGEFTLVPSSNPEAHDEPGTETDGTEGTENPADPTSNQIQLSINAKYAGTFGNSLRVVLTKNESYHRWSLITYVVDASGLQTAVENKSFVFDINLSTDTLPYIDELESNFLEIGNHGIISNDCEILTSEGVADIKADVLLTGGSDWPYTSDTTSPESKLAEAKELAELRYKEASNNAEAPTCAYLEAFGKLKSIDIVTANSIHFKQWIYNAAYNVLDALQDKLSYHPNRIIVPGWDDQDVLEIDENFSLDQGPQQFVISPLHSKLMNLAYYSRCATAYLDIPRSLKRKDVYDDNTDEREGYAQKLARYIPATVTTESIVGYFSSHSALFAPWGKYTYAGTSKQNIASPSFLALMIERAMILNQSSQYEWQLPSNRKHNLSIGKLDYNISKKYLDEWQKLEGVGINCITNIPDMGISIWGNSTLYEVPPATYQALANLSTRKLVNAVEDLAYRCGISITFQYNNDQAYNAFYAGMTPLLDTMRNVGAIQDYYIRMSSDIDGLDSVNANSIIGAIYLTINGVVNDISIDLVALPPSVDLNQFRI